MAATKTVQNVLDNIYDIIKTESTSTVYPESFLITLIDSAQKNICNWTLINYRTKQGLKKPSLSFLESNTYFSSVQDTSLSAATTVGATTLSLTSSSAFPASGNVFIEWDIAAYTGNAANTLSGVTGVGFAHPSGTKVKPVFDLPSDMGRVTRMVYDGAFFLKGVDYREYLQELQKQGRAYYSTDTSSTADTFLIQPFYTILEGAYIVVFGLNLDSKMLQLYYQKTPTTLTATTDTVTIPDDYALHTLPYIAVSTMLYNRGEEDRAILLQDIGFDNVNSMYRQYSQSLIEDRQGTRVSTSYDTYYPNI